METRGKAKANLICDRCDRCDQEGHISENCPHYKKQREQICLSHERLGTDGGNSNFIIRGGTIQISAVKIYIYLAHIHTCGVYN